MFKKIENKDLHQQFRIHIEFNEDNFTLVILEKADAWKSEISWTDITKLADQLSLDTDEYYSTLKQYIENTPDNVDLQLTTKQTNKEFICYCKENSINVKYFTCKLKKIKFNEYVYELLDHFSCENQKRKQENEGITKEADELKKGQKRLEEKLNELVNRKTEEEQELLSNFVLVLNEKKRKIQHLNQTLQAFKAGRPVLNPQVVLKKPAKKEIKNESKEISESDSSNNTDGYNTDEDKSKNNIDISDEILPSTSKKNDFNSIFNESDDLVDLPKRRKIKHDNVHDVPSTSRVRIENKQPELQDDDDDLEENSPQISFNTQELLDCI